jgi:hypothetical protein
MSCATDRRILGLLVRIRMRGRRCRRTEEFFRRLTAAGRWDAGADGLLERMLPPRRDWPRPGQHQRNQGNDDGRDALADTLVAWVLAQLSTPYKESPPWLRELRPFIGGVRERLRTWTGHERFAPPQIIVQTKELGTRFGEPDKFRCLAQFCLEDQITISCVARYFRELVDDSLDAAALAFRTQAPPWTHHDAVDQILQFRQQHGGDLWVSEVDIRGFFDSLSHRCAIDAVSNLLGRVGCGAVDGRAMLALRAYLESYSFNLFGRGRALELAQRWRRQGHPVEVPWPEEELSSLGVRIETEEVGVPQGGSLSCFLANAVLDSADRAVRAVASREDCLYLRYCDDTIFISTSEVKCRRMLEAYCGELRGLRLPAHPPRQFARVYGTEREGGSSGFWSGKSKAPYRWERAGRAGGVPWCSFVGYQMRFDGLVRVRPATIAKEIRKQNTTAATVEREIRRHGQGLSRRRVLYRLRQRLRSAAVGSGAVGGSPDLPAFSWVRGFRKLRDYPALSGQLRELDRHRRKVVFRLAKRLDKFGELPKELNAKPVGLLKFEGFPYSYAALVERPALKKSKKKRP